MFLILAIEPDRRQANRLAAIARGPLRNAELLAVESVDAALDVLARRVPDLVLTSMLLSAKDDAALADRLREIDTPGRQVQTLVIPMFAAPRKSLSEGGLLARFTKSDDQGPTQGCQPAVFAGQINEYLERLQLDREAREMREPYSTPAEPLYTQPTVGQVYQEIVAAVPAEQVIVPEPPAPLVESPIVEPSTLHSDAEAAIHAEPPAASSAASPRPSIVRPAAPLKRPRIVTPAAPVKEPASVVPQPIEAARIIEPVSVVEPPRVVEAARIAEPPRVVVEPRAVEARVIEPRVVEPARPIEPHDVEAPAILDTPTAEPTRLIAPSPVVEPRRPAAKPARTESIVKPAEDDQQDEPVAEPARMIAPSPVAASEHIAPPPAARVRESEAPRAPVKPAPAASRPAAPAKAKPKVAKVRFEPPPLHEDPEVAKFMAALNELPTVDVIENDSVENDADRELESADAQEPAATAKAALEAVVKPSSTPTPSREGQAETPSHRETVAPPKVVKALKPARPRAISPAAAPPSIPSERKRVTPIRRNGSAASQSAPAPEAPAAIDEPPAASSAPVKVVGRIKPASAAPATPAAPRTGKQKGSSRRPRPIQDEWGFFDPDQCGFPAVQAALEEIEEPDIFRTAGKPPKPRG